MIVMQQENFYDWFPEAEPMLRVNNEISKAYIKGFDWELDLAWYKTAYKNNALIIVSLRDKGKLIGYHVSYVGENKHAKGTLFGYEDAIYLDTAYRGKGFAKQMFQEAEKEWKAGGAKVGCRYSTSRAPERDGYKAYETLYMKILED